MMNLTPEEIERQLTTLKEPENVRWLGQAIDGGAETDLLDWIRAQRGDRSHSPAAEEFRTFYNMARSTVFTDGKLACAGAAIIMVGTKGRDLAPIVEAGRPPVMEVIRQVLGSKLCIIGKSLYNAGLISTADSAKLRQAITRSVTTGEDHLRECIGETPRSLDWDGTRMQTYLLPFYFTSDTLPWWEGIIEEAEVSNQKIHDWAKRRFASWAGRSSLRSLSLGAEEAMVNERDLALHLAFRDAHELAISGVPMLGQMLQSTTQVQYNVWCQNAPNKRWSCNQPRLPVEVEDVPDALLAWWGFCKSASIRDVDLKERGEEQ